MKESLQDIVEFKAQWRAWLGWSLCCIKTFRTPPIPTSKENYCFMKVDRPTCREYTQPSTQTSTLLKLHTNGVSLSQQPPLGLVHTDVSQHFIALHQWINLLTTVLHVRHSMDIIAVLNIAESIYICTQLIAIQLHDRPRSLYHTAVTHNLLASSDNYVYMYDLLMHQTTKMSQTSPDHVKYIKTGNQY